MPQVRVRDKHQITLPAVIAREAEISTDDILDVSYKDGVITMTTKQVQKKRRSIMNYAGSANGLYGKNAEEVQAYLTNERASWEK